MDSDEGVSSEVSKLQLALLQEANGKIRCLEEELRQMKKVKDSALADNLNLREELDDALELLSIIGIPDLKKFDHRLVYLASPLLASCNFLSPTPSSMCNSTHNRNLCD